ncbi:MAG: hypothetical protein JNL96_21560 [Planctomycetaceae bacterium]|nr:hypothetical protein [Planctomycetaceae bacterium]
MTRRIIHCVTAIGILALVDGQILSAEPNPVDRARVAEHLEKLTDFFASDPYQPDGGWHRCPKVDLADLYRLPDGDPLRLNALALARKYANPADLVAPIDRGPGYHEQAHAKLRFAWDVLVKTGCLRPGMRLEEFVAIVGGPCEPRTVDNVTFVEWRYLSPMHVNPRLQITLENNYVKTIKH